MRAETAELSTDAPVAPLADSPPDSIEPETAEPEPVSLAALVDATPMPATIDPELRCLAGAVYFESRGESLAGQLAVARVIINRAESGRFPTSYCGEIGRAHVWTPVTNAHLVCRLLLEKKKNKY